MMAKPLGGGPGRAHDGTVATDTWDDLYREACEQPAPSPNRSASQTVDLRDHLSELAWKAAVRAVTTKINMEAT